MSRVGFVSFLIDYEKENMDKRIFSKLIPDYIEDPNWATFDIPFRSVKSTRESRRKSVIDNIRWANENKVDLLLFPGWTLSHPADLDTVSQKVGKNLHVVLEVCEGAVEYRNSTNDEDRQTIQSRYFNDDAGVFVLNNKEVSKGPIFQLFSEGKKQIGKKSNSGFIDQLKAELGRDCIWDQRDYESEHRGFVQGRWLEIGKNERFIILLCGETNLTNNKNYDWLEESKRFGFDKIDYSNATAILNPSHIPSNKYMVEKRHAWSKLTGVPLITCSNIQNQFHLSNGKFRLNAAMDGSQFFTKNKFYKIKDPSAFGKSDKNWIEIHNTDQFQRAIVEL